MAIGIDDAFTAAASGVKLADTLVKTIQAYRKKKLDLDVEKLIDEVRIAVIKRIDDADLALLQLERALTDKGVSLDKTLQETIASTPWWRPYEAYRLKQIRQGFYALQDSAYGAIDDIASLVRCKEQTDTMGHAVVESAYFKNTLSEKLLAARSVKESIDTLRHELARQKNALHSG